MFQVHATKGTKVEILDIDRTTEWETIEEAEAAMAQLQARYPRASLSVVEVPEA